MTPPDWLRLPSPADAGHKYDRGHAVVVSGGASATGAARLAATAALRCGAGLVTLAAPGSALQVAAAHLTAVMLTRADDGAALADILGDERVTAAVIGMGLGPGSGPGQADPDAARAKVLAVAKSRTPCVLDADALTAFADDPATLFEAIGRAAVLTPHEGEFARVFDLEGPREERAVEAAARSGAVVVLKGERTVVAAPDGRCHVNDHASPWLATAGSGDVLGGMVGGLLAQGIEPFEAARAAVWMHGDAGRRGGPGLIAEDLPDLLPAVLKVLHGVG